MEPEPDDLRAVADMCAAALGSAAGAGWETRAEPTEWTCRGTLEHLCGLAYAPQLATRAGGFRPLALQVAPGAPIGDLVGTMQAMACILAEVARAAPPTARAFHTAGMADPSGWVAMGMDELLVHTHDITAALGVEFVIDARHARAVLGRLFPWAPEDADPLQALLWANGRGRLPGHPSLGESWLWHCAPLSEWDGTVPRWDAVSRRPVGR